MGIIIDHYKDPGSLLNNHFDGKCEFFFVFFPRLMFVVFWDNGAGGVGKKFET